MPHENPETQSNLGLFSEANEVVYLLEESDHWADGSGRAVSIVDSQAALFILTLSINQTAGRGNLAVSVWGARNRMKRSFQPLLAFYDKSYCGMYSMPLDLKWHPEICYLRVCWELTRWTSEAPAPLFTFSVFLQHVSVPPLAR